MDWDDLKLLLAVADGGVSTAARNLNLEPHRIAKRIAALESALRCELATGTGDNLTFTASGQRAIAAARAIAALLAQLANDLGGAQGEVSGKVCVTCTAAFAPRASRAFAPLRDKHPALSVDVMLSSQVVDLKHGEADIAVRMFKDQQEGLAMRKLGTMGWSLYASVKYLAGRTPGANLLDGHQLIAYDASFSNTQGGRWIAANAPAESIAMRVGGIREALDAATAGHGVCVVPCYLAAEQGLARATDQVLTSNDVYAVYLAERGTEARLAVVIDTLVDMFACDQSTYAGTA